MVETVGRSNIVVVVNCCKLALVSIDVLEIARQRNLSSHLKAKHLLQEGKSTCGRLPKGVAR